MDLFLLATICFIAMVSPGPDFFLITKNALSYSKPKALATAFGVVTGALIHSTYCVLGLAVIITQSVFVFSTIKYVGACYLIYLGYKGMTSKPEASEVLELDTQHTITIKQAYIQGLLCNLLNPKLAVFLLSLFTQFISVEATIPQKIMVAGIFAGESLIYWPIVVLLLQSRTIQQFFAEFRVWLDRVCGLVLFGLGVKVALSRD